MPRHRLRFVAPADGVRASAVRLDKELIRLGYNGPMINWGRAGTLNNSSNWHNQPAAVALASNKRRALEMMRHAGVPCPADTTITGTTGYPSVGRTDRHHAGSGFWLAHNPVERAQAELEGATHWMEYIPNAREFRVHIAFGKSIKLTEKLHDGERTGSQYPASALTVRSHTNGWRHLAPRPNAHRITLRKHAKDAVRALGLDFGAVDILLTARLRDREVRYYVLEVNTAPGFQEELDTATRYAQALVRNTTPR